MNNKNYDKIAEIIAKHNKKYGNVEQLINEFVKYFKKCDKYEKLGNEETLKYLNVGFNEKRFRKKCGYEKYKR